MFHASLPISIWVKIFLVVVYLINRIPLFTLSFKSPYKTLFGKHANCSGIKILGCRCFPCLQDYKKNKFNAKFFPRVFIGYSPLHKRYRCLNPMTKCGYIFRHKIFDKTAFPFVDSNCLFLLIQDTSQIQEYSTYNELLQYLSIAKIPNTLPILNSSPIVLTTTILLLDKIHNSSDIIQMPYTSYP